MHVVLWNTRKSEILNNVSKRLYKAGKVLLQNCINRQETYSKYIKHLKTFIKQTTNQAPVAYRVLVREHLNKKLKLSQKLMSTVRTPHILFKNVCKNTKYSCIFSDTVQYMLGPVPSITDVFSPSWLKFSFRITQIFSFKFGYFVLNLLTVLAYCARAWLSAMFLL